MFDFIFKVVVFFISEVYKYILCLPDKIDDRMRKILKSSQITFRISYESKEKLTKFALQKGIKSSKFVRQIIEQYLYDTKEDLSYLDQIRDKITKLENQIPLRTGSLSQNQLLVAFAHILSVDLHIPIHEAIDLMKAKVSGIAQRFFQSSDLSNLSQMDRMDRESSFLEEFNPMLQNMGVSPMAKIIFKSIYLCYMAIDYKSPLFEPYGISLELNSVLAKKSLS